MFFEASDMQKRFGLNTTNKSFRLAMWNNISCDGIQLLFRPSEAKSKRVMISLNNH